MRKKKLEGRTVVDYILDEPEIMTNYKIPEGCCIDNPDDVYKCCRDLFADRYVNECIKLLNEAVNHRKLNDPRLIGFARVFEAYHYEACISQKTMLEYLPDSIMCSLDNVSLLYGQLVNAVGLYRNNRTDEMKILLDEFVSKTHFSPLLVDWILRR